MQIEIEVALIPSIAKCFNKAGAVWGKLVKWVFHNAPSYSAGAVLSQTTPPPAFSVTSPASIIKLRIAILNSDRPSGAAHPIAPQ